MGSASAGWTYVTRSDARAAGQTWATWLAGQFPHSDAATWAARLYAGEVDIDGLTCRLDAPARPGAEIVWRRPPWVEEDVPLHAAVVWEDDDLLVVDKPAGLPTMAAGGFVRNTLIALVRERRPEASPMHRLGRGTSGLVLFGCSPRARSGLQAAWRRDEVDKTYVARVLGTPPWENATLTTPIGLVAHPRLGEIWAAAPNGKPSMTVVRVVSRGATSVVEADLRTGRPHQIRIHLAAAGHPLDGDPLYVVGGHAREDHLPGDGGYCLHATRLRFVHPVTGRPLDLVSAPPWPVVAALEPVPR